MSKFSVRFLTIGSLLCGLFIIPQLALAQCGDPPDPWSTWSQYVAVCSKYGGHISNQRCVGWDTNWCNKGTSSNSGNSAPAGPSPEELERQRLAEEQRQLAEQQRLEEEKKRQEQQQWNADVQAAAASLKGVSSDDMQLKGVNDNALTLKGVGDGSLELKGPSTAEAGTYVPSGNALIGGTGWITGFNVQNGDPAMVARERAMLSKQMELAGRPYAEGVDFKRYNFVIGIAASTDNFTDLANRVVFDEFKNGRHSADEQRAYDSLKGRKFGELGCHSNGAMICLAALENKDVEADHVVLYGPQVTVESLGMWNDLIRLGRVKAVQIVINNGDPIPPISLLAGGGVVSSVALDTLALLRLPTLSQVIEEIAPRVTVRAFDCGTGAINLSCHDMSRYKTNVAAAPHSSGITVPGTTVPGHGGTLEPPPPQ
jgi:hypothetical protein